MPRHDVQAEFSHCVRSIGGSVLDEILVRPSFPNADFWFPQASVVAELKCLSENYFAKESFRTSLSDKYKSWVIKGLVAPLAPGRTTVNLADLPVQCANEVLDPLKRKLEASTLKKANRQIRETREHFNAKGVTGLLLLVNDGNLALPPNVVRSLVARSLKNQYRCINTVIHLSINELVSAPGVKMPTLFWAQWSFGDRSKVDQGFLEQLRSAWFAHHSTLVGEDIYEIIPQDGHDPLRTMRFSRGAV
jgi:hypothetical protein